MNEIPQTPIQLEFKKASSNSSAPIGLRTFSSYSFANSILTPASPFRFTAPGVDKDVRMQIRSGDWVSMYIPGPNGLRYPITTGIVDETDTHITANSLEYVISGRDILGQLVDNAVVDAQNKIINSKSITLENALSLLIQNTRIPGSFTTQSVPTVPLLLQTGAGETKINALQRYLEFTNCLVWVNADGTLTIGKPNFTQEPSGKLVLDPGSPQETNILEARVKRDVNQAIRQIVTQLQTSEQVDPGSFTKQNSDPDILPLIPALVGRSVYSVFSYGQGQDAVNQIYQVGNGQGAPKTLGEALSLREIARENVKIIEVECIVQGHLNENGEVYALDQVYSVVIPDENVHEDMYVYSVSYELTLEHGMMTKMNLCRLGAICADAPITSQVNS